MSSGAAETSVDSAESWIPDDASFGARLALVRQRMGWGNVKEAALACGLPVESWRTWERDNVQPRNVVQVARKISTRTGCDLGWLVGGPGLSRVRTTQGQFSAPVRPPDRRPKSGPGGPNSQRPTQPVRRTTVIADPAPMAPLPAVA
jgi:hypothetical protein